MLRNSCFLLFCFLSISLIVTGCSTDDDNFETIVEMPKVSEEDIYVHDQPANEGEANALAKARLVAGIEWTPLLPIPSVYDKKYASGMARKGLPYSLAQKVNGYVGLDVSFYSFLTAIHNPHSVMYTENLATYPYFGFDCAPYYGSVCATSIWYILGLLAPYYTSAIDGISALEKKDSVDSDSIKLCDVLWSKGHVAMVYDIVRGEDSTICAVSVFETTRIDRADSRIITYSAKGFYDRWNRVKWVIYRPKDLSDNTFSERNSFNVDTSRVIPLFTYNDEICTSRGDRVAYTAGDDVILNILSNQYTDIELFRNDSIYERRRINSERELFSNLPYGDYKARLVGFGLDSEFTFFEVIDVNVSYSLSSNKVTVYFSSKNGTPEFMSLGDDRECPYYCYILSPKYVEKGFRTVSKSMNYLKVHFRGKYGRVSNKLIRLTQ